MKANIVKFSELGTNCWLPNRFNGTCHTCKRLTCKQRTVRVEIQKLLDRKKEIRESIKKLFDELQKMEVK